MPTRPERGLPGVRRLALAVLAGALLTPGAALAARPGAGTEPLPERAIATEVVLNGENQLVLRGDVEPGHAERPVLVQKKNCRSTDCVWHRYAQVRTDERGRFRARIDAPRRGSDFYRAKVRAHGGYAVSYSQAWRTWTD